MKVFRSYSRAEISRKLTFELESLLEEPVNAQRLSIAGKGRYQKY